MRNKIKAWGLCALMILTVTPVMPGWADADIMDETIDVEIQESVPSESEDVAEDMDEDVDAAMDELSAGAIAAYDVEGSLFEQITTLEQEKVLMQLEKERAQLDLELSRLAAEKIKLQMELDTLSGRAEQQTQEFEVQKAKLEAEAARLAAEKDRLAADAAELSARSSALAVNYEAEPQSQVDDPINARWRLVNVIGAGNQLQATVEDLNNGQQRRLSVGKTLDGYTVTSISIDDGLVFDKDGVTQHLNIGNGN